MKKTSWAMSIAIGMALMLSISGCGTLLTRSFGMTDKYDDKGYSNAIYSGTAADFTSIPSTFGLSLIDLPLSLAADSLYLPFAIYDELFCGWFQAQALKGDVISVKNYLAEGTDVNESDWQGHTALMGAARGGHEDLIVLLLQHGADPKRYTKTGHSAWSYAQRWKQEKPTLIQLLELAGGELPKQPVFAPP